MQITITYQNNIIQYIDLPEGTTELRKNLKEYFEVYKNLGDVFQSMGNK